MSRPHELPMFPLGTVLFPGGYLPLHVFEPRYRVMTAHCLEGNGRMGVVLIERGSEVGGGDIRHEVGTRARIVQSAELEDGRWLLVLEGEARVQVDRWLPERPFPRAEVTPLPEGEAGSEAATARRGLEERVARAHELLVELGELPAERVVRELADDPVTATWQAASLAPFGPADAQRVLETEGVDRRMSLVATLLDEQIDLLALRASWG